VRLLAVLL